MARPPVTPRLPTPWPYTEAELQKIRDSLPAEGADGAIEWVILAASFFLGDRWGPRPKPHQELLRALLSSEALTRAAQALSVEALAHLPGHPWPGARDPSHPYDLGGVLPRFEHDCRVALRRFERPVIGAPVKRDEEALIYRLWIGWRSAGAARGWPAFRSACIEPLMTSRFAEKVQPARREERAWQSLLRRARARFEGARNQANFDQLNCVDRRARKAHHLRTNRGGTRPMTHALQQGAADRRRNYRRREAAAYIREKHNVPCAETTLATLASRGGGPCFYLFGKIPIYPEEGLDSWVEARMGAPVRSTSEARGVPREPHRKAPTASTTPAEPSRLGKPSKTSLPASAAANVPAK
jgi:hypothetical protein